MDRDLEHELAVECRLTEKISEAKAVQVISARGISLEAAKRVHLLIPMPEAFGSTKKIRRDPDRSQKVPIHEESRAFQFTAPGTQVMLVPPAARAE
jgi:hypothetical protein